MTNRCAYTLAGIAIAISLSGCNSFDLRRSIPWGAGRDGYLKAPMKVVAVWTESVAHTPGAPPQRGFGGRLFFYGVDEDKPVKVKGQLEVYCFDESNRDVANAKPDKKIIYPKDRFVNQVGDDSPMGPSYSVWVPWGNAGGPEKEISLIARFTPEDGALVLSEMTTHILHGTESPRPQTSPVQQQFVEAVRQVAYERDEMKSAAPRQMQTTTIPLRGMRLPVARRQQERARAQSRLPNASNASVPGKLGSAPLSPTAANAATPLTRFGPGRPQAQAVPFAPLELAHEPWKPSR